MNERGLWYHDAYYDWATVRFALTPHRDGSSPMLDRRRPRIDWGEWERFERPAFSSTRRYAAQHELGCAFARDAFAPTAGESLDREERS